MGTYDIQELIELSRVPRRTIYFYIQQGIIPPPRGAGQAAKYDENHLLRLQLIPIFRSEGKRLDEIRDLLNLMGEEEMRERINRVHTPKLTMLRESTSLYHFDSQDCILFRLPKGIQLLVPMNLEEKERKKVLDWMDQFSTSWNENK